MEIAEKFIGIIKWFGDQQREANYGFIQHTKLGDIYFNWKSIVKGQLKNRFYENKVVVFEVIQSAKKNNSLEAQNVLLIENEKDIFFLFSQYLLFVYEKNTYIFEKSIFDSIQCLSKEIEVTKKDESFNLFLIFINQTIFNYEKAKIIINLAKLLFSDFYEKAIERIFFKVDKDILFRFWVEKTKENADIDYIFEKLKLDESDYEISKIFSRCNDNERINILFKLMYFLSVIDDVEKYTAPLKYLLCCQKYEESNQSFFKSIEFAKKEELFNAYFVFINKINFTYEKAIQIINITKSLFNEFYDKTTKAIFTKLDKNILFRFWLEKIKEDADIDYISHKLTLEKSDYEISKIFNRCNENEKTNIINKLLYDLNKIDSEEKYNRALKYISFCQKYDKINYKHTINYIIQNSPSHYRLSLWLDDISEYYNFDEFVIYTITLTDIQQKVFFKKTFKLIHEGKVLLNLADLNKINTMDYGLSKEIEKISGDKIDYTISVIIQVLIDLSKGQKTSRQTIFEIVARQIRHPKDLLNITGFFDECEGRCNATKVLSQINYERTNKKPRFSIFCDGQKAMKNNLPSICDKTGAEFWWCENRKCYKPSRKEHTNKEWLNYSLSDFLKILKIDYKEIDYEVLLNVINRVNRFFKHLKCASCSQILRPIGKSNYAFYGVTRFQCVNKDCEKCEKEEIYLSHCLNGKCESTIDSRNSVKCKPQGHDSDKCGWYVCNYCHACCSTDKLNTRQYIYNKTGQTYNCQKDGHSDLGEICCNKCGSPMKKNAHTVADYQKTLNWFIDNKERSPYIANNGQRTDNKWWFIFVKGDLTIDQYRKQLSNLITLGFNVPDYDKESKVSQLVAEPSTVVRVQGGEILNCSNCGHVVDLRNDIDKYNAIKHFHPKIFAPVD